jgi:hypothetical protein
MRPVVALTALALFLFAWFAYASAEKVVPDDWCKWPSQTDASRDSNQKPAATSVVEDATQPKKEAGCPDSRADNRTAEDDGPGWDHFWTDPVKTSNIVIAAFTVVLAVSTIFLWISTRGAAKAALRTVDTMRATERGWLKLEDTSYVDGFHNVGTSEGLRGPESDLVWINVGRSACTSMSVDGVFLMVDKLEDLPLEPAFSANPSELQLLLKPDETFSRKTKLGRTLTREEETAIKEKKMIGVHIAKVTYRDAFDERHETRVFYYWKVHDNGSGEWTRGERQNYTLQT